MPKTDKSAPDLAISRDDIDRFGSVAIYAQLRDFIAHRIRSGALGEGTRLPTVRSLADRLDVNTMTVARAFKELAGLGLIQGKGPRGTFVSAAQPARQPAPEVGSAPAAQTSDQDRNASFQLQRDDTFARMLRASSRPSVIPLTQAYPDLRSFDADGFEAAAQAVLAERPASLYAYVPPDGLPSLKAALVQHVCRPRGLDLKPESIVVTSGGQQSLAIAAMSLLKPGDTVVVEQPTYFGALDLFRALGVTVVGVPMQTDGPDMRVLERVVRDTRPSLIFVIPTFHNPTGVTTSLAKRRAILDLSRRSGVPVLEDDCCSEMRFTGEALPSIKALSGPEDAVFYFSSMGKVFVPGIRLGFLAAPQGHLAAVVRQKTLADLHTAPLLQLSFERFLTSGAAHASARRARGIYADVLTTLADRLGDMRALGAGFTIPEGGLNIWLTLPEDIEAIDLFYDCLQRNVSILLGRTFCVDDSGPQAIRLSFGMSDKAAILSAIDVIEDAIRLQRASTDPQFPVLV